MPRHYPDGTRIRTYAIERTLGEGGFARAIAARDASGGRVFLKLYTDPTPLQPWYRGFLRHQDRLRETLDAISSTMGGMTYSVVEGAHEFFEHDGLYWQAKEWVDGRNLAQLYDAAAENPASFADEQRMTNAKVMLHALALVHEKGIVHCDLKPQNVFMMEVPGARVGVRVKLVDFDFSFFVGETPPWASHMNYMTTPGYESPEHLQGQHPTAASDVFTTGIMLYELLCGAHPFASPEDGLHRRCPRPEKLNDELPPGVCDAMWSMLDPSPANRPSARDVHRVLLTPGVRVGPMPQRVRLSTPQGHWSLHKSTLFTRDMGRSLGPEYKYLSAEQFQVVRNEEERRWEVLAVAGATNRTHLNGEVVADTPRPLCDGDEIRVGELRIRVAFEGP